jgi:hypothetical protein
VVPHSQLAGEDLSSTASTTYSLELPPLLPSASVVNSDTAGCLLLHQETASEPSKHIHIFEAK